MTYKNYFHSISEAGLKEEVEVKREMPSLRPLYLDVQSTTPLVRLDIVIVEIVLKLLGYWFCTDLMSASLKRIILLDICSYLKQGRSVLYDF